MCVKMRSNSVPWMLAQAAHRPSLEGRLAGERLHPRRLERSTSRVIKR
jgi:hypothetical protein